MRALLIAVKWGSEEGRRGVVVALMAQSTLLYLSMSAGQNNTRSAALAQTRISWCVEVRPAARWPKRPSAQQVVQRMLHSQQLEDVRWVVPLRCRQACGYHTPSDAGAPRRPAASGSPRRRCC